MAIDFKVRFHDLKQYATINDVRTLLCTILFMVSNNAGGEVFVENPSILSEFVSCFPHSVSAGGTPARAARALDVLGFSSLLHLVTTNEHVRELIPSSSKIICSNPCDSLYPHIIIQYDKDSQIFVDGTLIETNRANRIIFNNNQDLMAMKLNTLFFEEAKKCQIFLLSGFNAIRNMETLKDRLELVETELSSFPKSIPIIYEDACFQKPEFSRTVWEYLCRYLSIYSLNEEEFQAYIGHSVNLFDVNQVRGALDELSLLLPVPLVLVHTQYWALAFGKKANHYRKALTEGIALATTCLRFGNNFKHSNFLATKALPGYQKSFDFSEKINSYSICCLPSLSIQEKHVHTVGLGDTFIAGFISQLAKGDAFHD
jgi:ADP-dependent phosphofructokinase/glucokinase